MTKQADFPVAGGSRRQNTAFLVVADADGGKYRDRLKCGTEVA